MNRMPDSVNCRGLACLDRSGATVSALCAIHCGLTPILIALLPAVGLGILADEAVETALMSFSVLLGVISLGLGYRIHRSPRVVLILVVGFALLGAGRYAEGSSVESIGTALVVGGGLAIAGSHLLSHRLCRPHRTARRPMGAVS